MRAKKKGSGVPRPKKVGSVSGSNLSAKAPKGFPPTPSRAPTRGLPTRKSIVKAAMEHAEFKASKPPAQSIFDYNLRSQLFTGYAQGALWMRSIALGIAAKIPQRVSARNHSGKPGASRATPKTKKP